MYASVLNGLCIQACVRVAIVWNAVSLCEFSSAPSGPDECVHRCYVKGSWEDVRWTRKNLPNDSKQYHPPLLTSTYRRQGGTRDAPLTCQSVSKLLLLLLH
ncbi:hypothetical protein EGR_10698 [Echinococcus granulosus]|uniref:Uncharacterized protein n=1 Tax=Echinococcus granulosus TaxID=6210 RepID=W6U1Q2_ECHGR|nr:hypothetical protein EGR_10698 [Echinococcus granulosus]EUB54446.1 hypothetical protein EGR_10698 [Echinococcus granulosus]